MTRFLFLCSLIIVSLNLSGQTTLQANFGSFQRSTPLMGINGNAVYNNTWTNQALRDSAQNLNPSVIRYPAGLPSNVWNWQTGWFQSGSYSCPSGITPALTVRHEELKLGLDACNADMLYTLNVYNSNINNQLQGVNHAASLGIPISYLELGNEHNLSCDPIAPAVYAATCKTWADTLKTHYPNADICLVGGDTPAIPNWIISIQAANVHFDAFAFHVYPSPNNSDGVFHVRRALANAYAVPAQRYTASHFNNMPSKSVWVTEYNMGETVNPRVLYNTWTHCLFLMGMFDTLMHYPNVTMMIPWALSGATDFESIQYMTFKMHATGVATKLINDASRGLYNCRPLVFAPAQYQSYGSAHFPKIFGWEFYNGSEAKALLVNISATSYNVDLPAFLPGTSLYFTQYSADTAQFITNGLQSLNRTAGSVFGMLPVAPFSITLLQTVSAPLAVKLTNFRASLDPDGTVQLSWTTVSETAGLSFEIERSTDASDFKTIGRASGQCACDGSLQYQWTDPNPCTGACYYRIKIIEADGNEQYSGIAQVEAAGVGLRFFPNPASDWLAFQGEKSGLCRVFDTDGRLVMEQMLDHVAGISVSNLPTGLYRVALVTTTGVEQGSFVKR